MNTNIWNEESYKHSHGDNHDSYDVMDSEPAPATAPVAPAPVGKIWIDSDGKILDTAMLAGQGYRQDPEHTEGFLTKATGNDYCEQVAKIRVHVAACDGDFTKVFSSFDKAADYVKSMGFRNDGGVCCGGYSRFDGVNYKLVGSKTWFPSRDLDLAVLAGKLS